MKNMNRTQLMRYINNTVMTYENLEVTRNVLWDYMCDCDKILDWLTSGSDAEPLYIAIRKSGLETGSKEHVDSRCSVLGSPIHTIEVRKDYPNYDHEFEVKEY